MATASPQECNGNASGNGNRILSPTLNWKSNNKPEEVNLQTWFLRGAAVGAGIAVSVAAVDVLKNWWYGKERMKDKAAVDEELRETQKLIA